MAVSIPGVVLSSLMFQLKNSSGDTAGFLLGETLHRPVVLITDADSRKLDEERKTCIQWFVLVPGRRSFTDARGNIDFNKVDELLERQGAKMTDVVGWFSYRCNSSHRMSLLERAIHCNFIKKASVKKDFLFGIFTDQTPESSGLLSQEYSLSTWKGTQSRAVSVEIVNLKSTSDLPYQQLPIAPIPTSFTLYQDFVQENRLSGGNQESYAEKLYHSLLQKLMPLKEELDSSVRELAQLQEEISELKLRKVDEEVHTAGSSSNPVVTGDDSALPLLIQLGDAIVGTSDEPAATGKDSNSMANLLDNSPPFTPQQPLIPTNIPPTAIR